MWELENKKGWVLKNWCFWTVVLEKTLESSLNYKEIQPVHPKGNQSWVFILRTDAEAEAPILWPPDAKNGLIGKDPDAGKDWRQEEQGTTEDEMVGWHHRLNGHEFEQVLGVGDRQGSLVCCSPWGCKTPDMIEQLNWIKHCRHSVILKDAWKILWLVKSKLPLYFNKYERGVAFLFSQNDIANFNSSSCRVSENETLFPNYGSY